MFLSLRAYDIIEHKGQEEVVTKTVKQNQLNLCAETYSDARRKN